jgi:hypothetical protein
MANGGTHLRMAMASLLLLQNHHQKHKSRLHDTSDEHGPFLNEMRIWKNSLGNLSKSLPDTFTEVALSMMRETQKCWWAMEPK